MTKTLENLVTGRHIHWVGIWRVTTKPTRKEKGERRRGEGGIIKLEFFEWKREHYRVLNFWARYNKFLSWREWMLYFFLNKNYFYYILQSSFELGVKPFFVLRKCLTFFCKGSLHYSAAISWFVIINSSAQATDEFFMSTVRMSQNRNGNNLWSPRPQRWSWIVLSLQLWSGRFMGITGWHPSVCKPNWFASLRCGDVNPKSTVKKDT